MVRRARGVLPHGVLTVEPPRPLVVTGAVLDPVPPAAPLIAAVLEASAPVVLFRHALGVVLRTERTTQGRTLQQVARAARVSVAFVSEVERGMKQPSSEILAALSTALEVSLSEVVARSADLLRQSPSSRTTQLRAA